MSHSKGSLADLLGSFGLPSPLTNPPRALWLRDNGPLLLGGRVSQSVSRWSFVAETFLGHSALSTETLSTFIQWLPHSSRGQSLCVAVQQQQQLMDGWVAGVGQQ